MARDLIHQIVKTALEHEGWEITDDPLRVFIDDEKYFEIDLGAEKVLAARKGDRKIAVEIKSFATKSLLYEFHEALGQYMNYRSALRDANIEREMYLAISANAWQRMSRINFILNRLEEFDIRMIIVNLEQKAVESWIQ